MKKLITFTIASASACVAFAEVTSIFMDTGDLAANFSTIKGDASSTPDDSSGELRIADFSTADKPEAYVYLTSPLMDGFQLDFDFRNESQPTYNADGSAPGTASNGEIRFRFGNDIDPTSNSKTGLQLGFKWDTDFRFGYDNGDNGGLSTSSVSGEHDGGTTYSVSLVANNSTVNTLDFTMGGVAYTLQPLTYSIFVDGVLADQDILLQTGTADYDPAAGISRFGFLGDSDAKGGAEVYFDNVVLKTGDSIGEGGSSGWLGYMVEDGYADTGNWLGLVNVVNAPWIYNEALTGWMYLEETSASEDGAWIWVYRP
ncbi:hypothetical protein [Oceanipulchritudo coccoides]|nr:hypothetical protein [Oceanipulchritudo coccoides]